MIAWAYLFPPLSVGGASLARTYPVHQRPLVEPCVRFARTRLSDHLRPPACTGYLPARPGGIAATGTRQALPGGPSLAAIPPAHPGSGTVKVRLLPSAEVAMGD